ncbi:MAG: HzsA-related protein, partial [Thermoguttaceae bacterium]
RDWIYQDYGLRSGDCFAAADRNDTEQAMVRKVLVDLESRQVATGGLEQTLGALVEGRTPGSDPAWKDLYFRACELRRRARLQVFGTGPREFVYAKHFVFGDCQAMFAMTDHLTDAVFRECGADYRMDSQLCKMRIHDDGTVSTEVLLDCPEGIVRDPCVSFDGSRVAFSMRRTSHDGDDDFHLYMMDLTDRDVEQITFGAGTADMEPEWLPGGELVFTSTRCVVSAPCWWSSVCNLYTCDAQGRYIRRLGYDHGHTVFPHLTNDGRITYTRWEYSDRTAGYLHTLFVMNADGTNQTEFYGNNSQFPAAVLHARSVPDSTQVIAIAGAHHIDQRGKLIMIDRKAGMQAGVGVKLLAPERDYPYRESMGTGGNIVHDTEGEQFQYPYPLDEDNYLVCYSPEGGPIRGLKGMKDGKAGSPPFGIYWMHRSGERELLVFDPVVSSGQQVAVTRPQPFRKVSAVDEHQGKGQFYIQNIYHGPGLEGVRAGTVKKIRVVGLDYRAKGTVALGLHPWGGHQTSPCAINNGSYDVKHVLGTVKVEEDGSCYFECPSRVPVYFQMLDERGRMVQNMRSWTMVLPGETAACIGCHEDKNSTFIDRKHFTLAMERVPQQIEPFYAKGDEPVQEMDRFLSDSEKRAMRYLGTNAPQGMDVPRGFSYTREIQPIWDEHCIECHAGDKNPARKDIPLSLLGDDRPITNREIYGRTKWRLTPRIYATSTKGNPGRSFSESYVNLTDFGYNAKIPLAGAGGKAEATQDSTYLAYYGGKPENVPNPDLLGYCADEYAGKGIVNWLHVSSTCAMLPPYAYGSTSSPLMECLEPSHYGVQLTREEKERVACWIDLNVPFAGSWMELNCWDRLDHAVHSGLTPWYVYRDKMRQIYLYFEAKRLKGAELELEHLDKSLRHIDEGEDFQPANFSQYAFGGRRVQREFVEAYDRLPETVPIYGLAEGRDSRGGTNVAGNELRNLAVNRDGYTYHLRSYPRATSNSHYRYRPEFSPNHAIDGDRGSGAYWRPARRTDLWLTVEFGREVEAEQVILVLHQGEGQEKTWTAASLEFSGGERMPIELKNTRQPQKFTFPKRKCVWVRLADLQERFPLGDNGIAEFEVYGWDP